VFYTLPIVGYQTIDGQDANVVNPAHIESIVNAAFYAPPAAKAVHHANAEQATVDVFNGGGTQGLAHHVSAALVKAGYRAGQIGDTSGRTTTAVLYGRGTAASARAIAKLFGVRAVGKASVLTGHVEILLGAGATVPVISHPSPSVSPSPAVSIPTSGPQGGAVNAENGIPCVD
jgi:LytR cell envelope-related transcriptional attenuator